MIKKIAFIVEVVALVLLIAIMGCYVEPILLRIGMLLLIGILLDPLVTIGWER